MNLSNKYHNLSYFELISPPKQMLLATGQKSIINLIVLYTLRHKRKKRNVCVCVIETTWNANCKAEE